MSHDIFGFGNTLVDIIIQIDEGHITELDLRKGTLHLISEEKMKNMMEKFKDKVKKIVPAGSTANTIFALSSLGSKVILCGKIGEDPHGNLYEEIVINDNISSRLKRSKDVFTGKVINLVTPDSERTFMVNLGASLTLSREDLSDVVDDLKRCKIMHTEGYVLGDPVLKEPSLFLLRAAKENDVKVSVDLSDPGVIEANLDYFKNILQDYVDIVFLNETEAKAFTGLEPEEAIDEISKYCDIVVVKLGPDGSIIKEGDETITIKTEKVKAIDATGAGDFYAAGFLHGYSKGKDLDTCGKIGSIIAAKVVTQLGARPPKDLIKMEELKGLL